MTIGAAIFIAALGAILRYAISDNIEGIDLGTVGTILIIAGVVGLIVGLALAMGRRGDRYIDDPPRDRYIDDAPRDRYVDDRPRSRVRDDRF